MPICLQERLETFKRHLDRLPQATEPPQTTLQILGRNRYEQDWQRLLFYLLSPDEPHGLDRALLDHFLRALSNRSDLSYTFSSFDLKNISVEREVVTSNNRRADAVMWSSEDWFLCWELKLTAAEGDNQTRAYVDADSFPTINVEKESMPEDGHHYVYLAPEDGPPPEADEFVPVSWEWVASQLQSFLADSHGAYPARTTAQIDDFISTINSELKMTEYSENQQEKAVLYFDYYDEIEEARDAFEQRWEEFADTWATALAESMEIAEVVEEPALPDSDEAIKLRGASEERERWNLRQGDSDWGGFVKEGWWRRKDDLSKIFTQMEDKKDVRISLYHRMKQNRELAIRERTLEIQLWHGTGNGSDFMYAFKDNITELVEENPTLLPPNAELTGKRGNPLIATYDIPEDYDDFFEAYATALEEAFLDIAVDNEDLVTIIDQAFDESIAMFK